MAQKLLNTVLRRPVDTLGVTLAVALSGAILFNGLYMQRGPHPAPLLPRSVFAPPKAVAAPAPQAPAVPATRASAPDTNRDVTASLPRRSGVALMTDIQTELARRGFYDGAVDGVYGPRMDAAIREFEEAAGLPGGAEPDEALLAQIQRSNVKANGRGSAAVDPKQASHRDGARSTPSARIIALQRALTRAGYGKLKLTGVVDEPTRTAIEKLERDRKLPVKGQASERVIREVAAITGRPLE